MLRGRVLQFFILVACATGLTSNSGAGEPPRVVASIAPVHGLVSMVMAGVGVPYLLLPGQVSPHAYRLKPSDARTMEDSQVVFWIGPALETMLIKPMETIAANGVTVQLMDARALKILPRRAGGVLVHDDDGSDDHAAEGSDPHIWLNPVNAIVMLFVISETLGEVDPENAAIYRANAIDGIDRLKRLDSEIDQMLAAVREVPYVAFHDAYQYFEERYGLAPVATIAVGPDRAPGARRVSEVKTAIAQSGVGCVFTEPQFDPKLVATLIERTPARAGNLDPLGADISPGAFFYEELMRTMAQDLVDCLGAQ